MMGRGGVMTRRGGVAMGRGSVSMGRAVLRWGGVALWWGGAVLWRGGAVLRWGGAIIKTVYKDVQQMVQVNNKLQDKCVSFSTFVGTFQIVILQLEKSAFPYFSQ